MDQSDVQSATKFSLKATGEEAKNYDYSSARPPRVTSSLAESTINLIKSSLGGGVVAIHEGYKQTGLFSAVLLNVILGFAVAYCMNLVARSAQIMYGRVQVPIMSYPDVAECSLQAGPWDGMRKYSKKFRYLVDFAIGCNLFGACCVYQVVIAKSIKQLVEGDKTGGTNIRIYIICLLIPCIALCMITQLKYLAPFSAVANSFLFTLAISTVYYGTKNASKSFNDMPHLKTFNGFLEFAGICVFSVEATGATMAIENNMTNPRMMYLVIYMGMTVVISTVMTIGFFGYYGFGEASVSPITLNFPMETFPIVLKGMMPIVLYITFALNFYYPFNLIWVYIKDKYAQDKHWMWERVYRALIVICITSVAVIFPTVTKFLGVLGSFCISNLGFVFPALIELSVNWKEPGLGIMKWRLIKAGIIICFGLFLFVLGTILNMKALLEEVFGL